MRHKEKKLKVLILGKGRVGEAIAYYLKKHRISSKVSFFKKEQGIGDFDVLIGALPSNVGKKGLELALKYKKDLIDVSALPISFYLKNRKEILKKEIRVFPGAGFSPGLVNLLLGFQSRHFKKLKKVEISSGTLPGKPVSFFPFTWCFEDLLEEHFEVNKKTVRLLNFLDYKKEKLQGIGEFESYLADEWTSLPHTLKPGNLSFRTIRPVGFFYFFQYLKNHGFFDKKNLLFTKKILTSAKQDNVTLALIKTWSRRGKEHSSSKILCFASKNEKLNSMQRVTGITPIILLKLMLANKINQKGIIFLEEVGKKSEIFKQVLGILKNEKSILVEPKGKN